MGAAGEKGEGGEDRTQAQGSSLGVKSGRQGSGFTCPESSPVGRAGAGGSSREGSMWLKGGVCGHGDSVENWKVSGSVGPKGTKKAKLTLGEMINSGNKAA